MTITQRLNICIESAIQIPVVITVSRILGEKSTNQSGNGFWFGAQCISKTKHLTLHLNDDSKC